MSSYKTKGGSRQIRAVAMAMLLLFTSISMASFNASAVGPNQNDLNSGGDLPDNTSVSITNYIFTSSYSGSGELDYGDDHDFLRVALTANQGLSATLSFTPSVTYPNGTTIFNDFDLAFYDANLTWLDSSNVSNPETLSTNNTNSPGGMVYIEITRFSGSGTWNLTLSKFTASSGTGGSNGSAIPNPCTGAGTSPDILEPNDTPATATVASILPIYCTGLSVEINSASVANDDYYEIQMISGVTYYFNLTFTHANGDVDAIIESSTGMSLSFNNFGSMSSSSDNEAAEYTATTNTTNYFKVYHYSSFSSGAVSNVYDIEITTDLPGGGQSMESIDVYQTTLTSSTAEMIGLTSGTNYSVTYSVDQTYINGTTLTSPSSTMNFTANGTAYNTTFTLQSPIMVESEYCIDVTLSDASGFLSFDSECTMIEVLQSTVLSSTSGSYSATNLTANTDYTLWWFVLNDVDFENNYNSTNDINLALNASAVYQEYINFTSSSTTESWLINWSGITTMDEHILVGILYTANSAINLTTGDGYIGIHDDAFIPQLPSLVVDSFSSSSTAATNNVDVKGSDLVPGDSYKSLIRITDAGGASIASTSLTSFTATAQNMSLPTFTYSTPNISGAYCAEALLYSNTNVQLIGDSGCFNLVFDDDNDSVANEVDLCPNSAAGAIVDIDGCALSQKDSDNDGYDDEVDVFPYDSSQYSDMDGDGYGDNPSGNTPDSFPNDSSQWSDYDADGYGDNQNGNNSDAFPYDPTQWSDSDGDGYGDNASGNNADEYPADSTQWTDQDGDGYGDNPNGTNGDQFPTDSTQWADQDGDGYGDNPTGNSPDEFPTDSTQWADQDGDGYGDNPTGNNGDAFPADSTQWADIDSDGYGDNQAGNDPDAFPMDGTQWSDEDGDGYGDNQNGNAADKFPTEPTQWFDADGDGYGDNANGVSADQCLNTPAGQSVDLNGCSEQQKDDDLDGVSNSADACPSTPPGETVDSTGCSGSQEDADNDGVMDLFDACPLTPLGYEVDAAGCADTQRDTDADGINDQLDECPSTTPEMPVNGVGCSAAQRDTDTDGINDMMDTCPMTVVNTEVDENGCADAQKDDDSDAIKNDADQCPDTEIGIITDSFGCAEYQRDADDDMIDDTVDLCPATPSGQQVNSVGCAASQLDQDNDSINNDKDLCPDTDESHSVDLDGCSGYQLDDDNDGVSNIDDTCPLTPESSIVFDDGCALSQMDTDMDNVNDAEDDFPLDPNETTDSDGDGISDTYDYYPNDPNRSEQDAESSGFGLLYAILALLIVCGLGAVLVVRRNQNLPENNSPFAAQSHNDTATEAFMNDESAKDLPAIETESQQWEENGVNWSKSADGSLHYYDNETGQWILYQTE